MSQHDFTIANQTASSARSDINSALQALASNNSGADAPTTTFANMWWYETGTNLLKVRNTGDNAWINVAYVNQSTNKFEILDDTKVVATDGTEVGILGDQTTVTWQDGTVTTESLVSPAKVKAAIDSLVSVPDTIGVNQSYAYITLTTNTWYQNTTGRAIAVYYQLLTGGGTANVSLSILDTGVQVGGQDGDSGTWDNGYFIVPDQHYYRTSGSASRLASMLS